MGNGRKVLGWALMMMVIGIFVFPVFATPQKYVLKFNHVLTEFEPFHGGFLKWAGRVKERTKGGLVIRIYPCAQLGMEEEVIEKMRRGENLGQNTDSARLGNYIPEIAVMNAPYFVESIDEVVQLKNSTLVKQWEAKLLNKYGVKVLSFSWVQGLRHIVTNKPVRTPKDLKNLRIRTPGAPIWQESIRAIGALPIALPFGEVYAGLNRGEIDGADLVYRNVTGAKLYESVKYISETNHIMLINFEVVGKQFFDSLPESYQQILEEECEKAGLETSLLMKKEVAVLKKKLISKGMTIVEDVDIVAFKKAGEKAYKVLNLTGVRRKIYKEMGMKYIK